jgi:outer membrane immunogenic protein
MRKKGFLIATSAGFAAAAAMPGAQAADMPIKAPRYYEPAESWTGWYAGVHAGAAWQKTDANIGENGDDSLLASASFSKTGFIGGGQIGYNWQHGNFVFGLEGDISGLSGRSSSNSVALNSDYQFSSQIRWMSTVRGRFGLAVGDTMAYMTAGVAFAGVKNSTVGDEGNSYGSTSKTRTGWAVGGGVEHMLSRNWTIGLEGLFVDLGESHFSRTSNGSTKTSKFQNQAVIGRVKLNYKF